MATATVRLGVASLFFTSPRFTPRWSSVQKKLRKFSYTSYREGNLRQKEQADKVRAATNRLVGKADRWREVTLPVPGGDAHFR